MTQETQEHEYWLATRIERVLRSGRRLKLKLEGTPNDITNTLVNCVDNLCKDYLEAERLLNLLEHSVTISPGIRVDIAAFVSKARGEA